MVKAAYRWVPAKDSVRLWMERGGSHRHFYIQFTPPAGGAVNLEESAQIYSAKLLTERCLGGRFYIHHGPPGPTTFTVTLPDEGFTSRETSSRIAHRHPMVVNTGAAPERGTILAADDSRTIRQLLTGILAKEHNVLMAGDGVEALRIARETLPDLILLDVIMPGMDGFAVCKALKEDPLTADIPVLFLTALSGDTDEALALAGGASDFIIKPISPPVLAARVRNHLELKRNRDRLRALTLLDGLTGIANRRRFDDQIQQEWLRCGRAAKPLSVILGDVDFFKRYNDGYGHVQGDECLRKVARAIADSLNRPGDLAARFGGEEFICILPETDQEGAQAVARIVHEAVAALALPHEFSDVADYVTISLGIATTWPQENGTIEDLTREADLNMYEAKRRGRNMVVG